MLIPVYNELQIKPAPMPGIRISTGAQPNAFLSLGETIGKIAKQMRDNQDGYNRAEAVRLAANTKEEFDSIIQQNAIDITDPEEYLSKTSSDLKDRFDTVTQGAKNSEIRGMLEANLQNDLLRAQRLAAAGRFNKQKDLAVASVDEARQSYGRIAVGAQSDEERKDAAIGFGNLVGYMKGKNFLSANQQGDMLRGFESDVRAGRQSYFATGLQDQLDTLTNGAFRDPNKAPDHEQLGLAAIDKAGADWLPPEKLNQVKSQYKNGLYIGAVKGKIDQNPYAAKAELAAGKYDTLIDPKAIFALNGEADTEIERRARKAEADRKERERQIGKLVSDYKDAKMAGFDWRGPVTEAKLGLLAKGTEHEADFANVQAAGRVLGQFNQLPPAAQEQYLRQSTEGAKTGTEAKFYGLLEGAHNKTVEGLKTDPLTFAIRQRLIPAPPPLNLNEPATMRERSRLAGIASQQYGVTVSPLSDDEAAWLKTSLDNSPADVQAATLRKLAGGFDSNQVKAIAGQFAKKDDKLMAFVMGTSVDAPAVASRILQGRAITKENPKVMPTGADAKTAQDTIQKYFGEAFMHNPEHNAAAMEAAQAIYAFKSWQARDLSGAVDPSRAKAAAEDAAGLLTLDQGFFFGGGYKIQPPKRGMNETDFWTAVNAADYSKVQGFKKDDIVKHGTFESVGDGKYLVRVGPGYVQSDRGPFILNLNPAR